MFFRLLNIGLHRIGKLQSDNWLMFQIPIRSKTDKTCGSEIIRQKSTINYPLQLRRTFPPPVYLKETRTLAQSSRVRTYCTIVSTDGILFPRCFSCLPVAICRCFLAANIFHTAILIAYSINFKFGNRDLIWLIRNYYYCSESNGIGPESDLHISPTLTIK